MKTQKVCKCQDVNLNWSIHTIEFWLQHLRKLYFQQVFNWHFKSKNFIVDFVVDASTQNVSWRWFLKVRFLYQMTSLSWNCVIFRKTFFKFVSCVSTQYRKIFNSRFSTILNEIDVITKWDVIYLFRRSIFNNRFIRKSNT